MTHPYSALADVFEKLADLEEVRAREAHQPRTPPVVKRVPKTAAEKNASDNMNELVRAATGENLPEHVVEKAAQDPELRDALAKLASVGAKPTPLGGPSDTPSQGAAVDRRQKLSEAFNNWGSAITGS